MQYRLGGLHAQAWKLRLGPGEILGTLGAKGGGKATLLRICRALLVQLRERWRFLVWLRIVTKSRFALERETFPKDIPSLNGMTVRKFLKFVSHFYPNWDEGQHAEKRLSDFEIDDETTVHRLSKGGKLKLAVVAAMGHRPQLLLLDEAALSQDPVWREVHAFFKQAERDEKVCIMLSSDVSAQLDRLADMVLMPKRGTVFDCAPAADVKKNYGAPSLEGTINVPMMRLRDGPLLLFVNAGALLLATLIVASTVISSHPVAAEVPILFIIGLTFITEENLQEYDPDDWR